MRAAMLTAMPRMLPSASTPPPSSTPPVCTPTRTLKPSVTVGGLRLPRRALAEFEQGQAAAHGAFGVVLAGLVGTEGGQHVVAGVLQHLAAVGLDDRGAARQGTVHHGADGFGVEVLGERGRADDVEEQDADLLESCAARRAACGEGARRAPAQGCECGVGNRIAEQARWASSAAMPACSCSRSVSICARIVVHRLRKQSNRGVERAHRTAALDPLLGRQLLADCGCCAAVRKGSS